MKAIMIAIKPKWCVKIMNGEKTIEVRKNKALAKAIQKLIKENGYAEIYVYCSKEKPYLFESDWRNSDFPTELNKAIEYVKSKPYYGKENFVSPCHLYGTPYGNLLEKRKYYNGKVAFKFRCYFAEVLPYCFNKDTVCEKSCLTFVELRNYLKDSRCCAIHISDLIIFDKPKELSEFKHYKKFVSYDYTYTKKYIDWELRPLTKAPQNLCYVEVNYDK